jgi:hypothetical protein
VARPIWRLGSTRQTAAAPADDFVSHDLRVEPNYGTSAIYSVVGSGPVAKRNGTGAVHVCGHPRSQRGLRLIDRVEPMTILSSCNLMRWSYELEHRHPRCFPGAGPPLCPEGPRFLLMFVAGTRPSCGPGAIIPRPQCEPTSRARRTISIHRACHRSSDGRVVAGAHPTFSSSAGDELGWCLANRSDLRGVTSGISVGRSLPLARAPC